MNIKASKISIVLLLISSLLISLLFTGCVANFKKDNTKVKIGYFSGSITHNADFEMIKPVLIEVLKKYENVELYLAGELDLPVELNPWKERIKKYHKTVQLKI